MSVSSAKASSKRATLPDSSARNQTGGELPARAQVTNERAHLRGRRFSRKRHCRLFAGLARDALSMVGIEPATRGDKIHQRLRRPWRQSQAASPPRDRRAPATLREWRDFPKTLENPIDRELGDLGFAIFRKHQTSLGRADLGERSRDRALQAGTARDGHLDVFVSGGDSVDQISVDEERRQRQDRRSDLRLIGCQRQHHGRRRTGACRQNVGQRPPYHGGGVIEQHQHRAFGRRGIVRRKIGIKVGARQRCCCFGPFAGRRGSHPIEKMADDHGFARARGVRGIRQG